MSKPIVTQNVGNLTFRWAEEQIEIVVSRIRAHRDGRTTAEVAVHTSAPGYRPHLHQASLNLSSSRSRKELEKILAERYEQIEWWPIIEQLAVLTLQHLREGEAVKELGVDESVSRPRYLLHPILPLLDPTVLYGDSGVGKSYLALYLALIAKLRWEDNPLNLSVLEGGVVPLYLDYETNRETMDWRLQSLLRGNQLPPVTLHYRFCAQPLADDIEAVQEAIKTAKANFLIVDSLAIACGGDLIAAEPAIRFFTALRGLKVTSLIITHIAKGDNQKTSPYGSAYFKHSARSVWEIRKVQEVGENEISIGLFHRKANDSALSKPLGAHLTFKDNTVSIAYEDVRDVGEFLEHLGHAVRIEALLKDGAMTVADIAKALGVSIDIAKTTLYRMSRKNKVVRVGGLGKAGEAQKWGLLATL